MEADLYVSLQISRDLSPKDYTRVRRIPRGRSRENSLKGVRNEKK